MSKPIVSGIGFQHDEPKQTTGRFPWFGMGLVVIALAFIVALVRYRAQIDAVLGRFF